MTNDKLLERLIPEIQREFDSCCLLYGEDATKYFIEWLLGLKLLLSDRMRMEVNRAAHDIIMKETAGFRPYRGEG